MYSNNTKPATPRPVVGERSTNTQSLQHPGLSWVNASQKHKAWNTQVCRKQAQNKNTKNATPRTVESKHETKTQSMQHPELSKARTKPKRKECNTQTSCKQPDVCNSNQSVLGPVLLHVTCRTKLKKRASYTHTYCKCRLHVKWRAQRTSSALYSTVHVQARYAQSNA